MCMWIHICVNMHMNTYVCTYIYIYTYIVHMQSCIGILIHVFGIKRRVQVPKGPDNSRTAAIKSVSVPRLNTLGKPPEDLGNSRNWTQPLSIWALRIWSASFAAEILRSLHTFTMTSLIKLDHLRKGPTVAFERSPNGSSVIQLLQGKIIFHGYKFQVAQHRVMACVSQKYRHAVEYRQEEGCDPCLGMWANSFRSERLCRIRSCNEGKRSWGGVASDSPWWPGGLTNFNVHLCLLEIHLGASKSRWSQMNVS